MLPAGIDDHCAHCVTGESLRPASPEVRQLSVPAGRRCHLHRLRDTLPQCPPPCRACAPFSSRVPTLSSCRRLLAHTDGMQTTPPTYPTLQLSTELHIAGNTYSTDTRTPSCILAWSYRIGHCLPLSAVPGIVGNPARAPPAPPSRHVHPLRVDPPRTSPCL